MVNLFKLDTFVLMKWLVAQLSILLINGVRILPFGSLHIKASATAWLLMNVVGYRKKVIDKNLKRCFPEKNDLERKLIQKKAYLNIADVLFESFKGLYLSKKNITKRFKILNPEVIDEYFEQGKSVMCLASHYANWEWGIQAVNTQIKHQAVSIYKPLQSNLYIEKFMLKKRSRLGMKLFSIYDTKEAFAQANIEPIAMILATDQHPSNFKKSIIANFFGERVGFLHGAEAYTHKTQNPVVYFDVQRVKRGYYTLEIKPLFKGDEKLAKGELTQRYASELESVIRKKPEDWLWSHKRWKNDYRNHPDY